MWLFSPTDITILGIIIAAHLVLGFLILFRDPSSATNRFFFALTASIVVWGSVNFFSSSTDDPESTLWLARFVLFSAIPFATFAFLLVKTFPGPTISLSPRVLIFIFLWSMVAMVITLSPYTFESIQSDPAGVVGSPVVGPGIMFFGATVLFFDLGALLILARRIIRLRGEARIQHLYLFLGLLLTLGSIIAFSFVLPTSFGNTAFIPFAAAFTFPFVGFTALAIVRYNLLNVRATAIGILIFVLASISLIEFVVSKDAVTLLTRVSVFVLILIFGILLLRSVLKEVKQRELIEALAKDLESANNRLRELDAAKTEFVSLASHQLRTPLTAIKGFLSMVIEGTYGQIPERLQGILQKVYISNERLIVLIRDLLDISRLESGKMIFEKKSVDLSELVGSVVDELGQNAKRRNLSLEATLPQGLPQTSLDTVRFRQVVLNLMDNAIKYTDKGTIWVRMSREGNVLKLEVQDTGRGMTQEDSKHLFGKFERGIEMPKLDAAGTGLGLYLARKIVEAHGGTIEASSPGLGKGSTLTVALPI